MWILRQHVTPSSKYTSARLMVELLRPHSTADSQETLHDRLCRLLFWKNHSISVVFSCLWSQTREQPCFLYYSERTAASNWTVLLLSLFSSVGHAPHQVIVVGKKTGELISEGDCHFCCSWKGRAAVSCLFQWARTKNVGL